MGLVELTRNRHNRLMNGEVFADAEAMNKRTVADKLTSEYSVHSMAERLVGQLWGGERKRPNAYEYLGEAEGGEDRHAFRFYKI